MKKKYFDKENRFMEIFDTVTGFYSRTGILDVVDGKLVDTDVDPFMRNFPQLIDVGVMGHCINGIRGLCGVQCYQNGKHTQTPNMTLEQFKTIVDQCEGKTFQFALGGRGDVDQHEQFEEILRYCRSKDIVPNFTTSGLGLTEEKIQICKELCGAVAVSWYRQKHTLDAINGLIRAGVTTNIHYVLGNNSIDEAITRLKDGSFPEGINAIVFLLHKPVGLGKQENVLKADDPKVKEFFNLIDTQQFEFAIGFDSCNCSAIVNFTKNINIDSIDYCESSRYSTYIDAQMNMMPCSFCNQDSSYFINLKDHTIEEAWNSEIFNKFRNSLRYSCKNCNRRNDCGGGCPIVNEITLCNRKEREFYREE